MVDKTLLSILACPQTKKDLELADQQTIDKINELIKSKSLVNQAKEVVVKKIDAGLFRVGDHSCVYPVRDNIPILLVDELILLDGKL